jgi:rhamnogalacturonyl hydrolase YesR
MTPPFLAISAILPTPPSKSLLLQSYNQISLYRKYLLDPSTSLFRHIALGNYQDNSLWATGNAWAAGGMLRVMETMKKSSLSGDADVKKCISDLENWTASIVEAAWSYQVRLRYSDFVARC